MLCKREMRDLSFSIVFFIHLQNEEDYERNNNQAVLDEVLSKEFLKPVQYRNRCEQVSMPRIGANM